MAPDSGVPNLMDSASRGLRLIPDILLLIQVNLSKMSVTSIFPITANSTP